MSSDTPQKKSFFRKPLGCLLTLFVAGVMFLLLAVVFAIWFAGSNHALKIASEFVNTKSGGTLTFADNDTNLFAGRVHYKGVEITNPSRFTDPGFVKINEVKADVDLASAASDTIHVREVIMDIGAVSLVGSEDWMKDNNALDFKKAFVGEAAAAEEPAPAEEPKSDEAGPKKHFRVDRLVLKLDRVRVLSHATTAGTAPKVIVDDSVGLNWEFTDISDENIKDKVWPVIQADLAKLGGKFANIAAAIAIAEGGKYVDQGVKEVTGAIDSATGSANQAVEDATKSITDGIGSLLGGDKKK